MSFIGFTGWVLPLVVVTVITSTTFFLSSLQRQAKYTENKLKAIKARNEYLLALEATNCCVFKYYIHDISDLIDVRHKSLFCLVFLTSYNPVARA